MKNVDRDVGHVYEQYHSQIKRFLQSNLRSNEDAEDLTQETFLRFQKHRDSVDMAQSKNFLFTIARNLMIDRIRHRKVSEVDPEAEVDDMMDPVSSVERQVSGQQEYDALCAAIENLPPKCRRVFILRKFYHFSHKEIAEKLDLSVSTIEKHLVAGLARCQAHMKKHRQSGEHEQ
ncbi:RNA polymerase sigma factor [Pseudomaricurvus alkylphenolicus]|jgi:RNA polymerase sigma-70 factor (ECF subfamily)|uniref:RNA polymerase sigma factor n=1 Tax=Pseudomaricurvus alkylphenolicus TaxID=1306991 RepID=UPI00141F2674|nr:RNA polymerase sigma factor [Pseudomaricurvus alkylphenolicus]NIB39587.1 RNA polymerase sigma factor [Pseudomaricurvus alkylphenolicus]